MLWLRVLPLALVALTVAYASISLNDPLRALTLRIPKKPELPICCLKPQQLLDPIEDEVLLSFEEWKRQQGDVINHTTQNNNATDALAPDNASDITAAPHVEEPQKPPHFRVPLTDRFNYASSECSARVHLAHRGAKSASSILSSKRDRYMLSPCNAENQFVVVELCEDIRIDTVQLANFEFFSGIFKEFKLSVAKTDMTAEGAFTDAGVFRAKNVRGIQSFHPPTSLRDFYRYIRIDFISHYGNEFYCPVSLLRVYGLTHLEQWKWDTWEQESREKAEAPREEPTAISQVETSTEHAPLTNESLTIAAPKETSSAENPAFSTSVAVLGSNLDPPPSAAVADTHHDSEPMTPPPVSTPDATKEAFSSSSYPAPTTSPTITQPNTSSPLLDVSQELSTTHTASSSSSTASNNSFKVSTSSTSPSVASTSNSKPPAPPSLSPSPLPPQGPGGESIYRTIMNRLTALEANHTLYARYVEQQTSGVREVLRRMGEDVGRLEGIVRAQEQVHSKTLKASEERMQIELGELIRRVESLRGEIEMEKRVGVAQVCLLAAVLVFMGLTRGSRGDQGAVGTAPLAGTPRKQGMREWGKRLSSLSGDWRFRRTKKLEDPFDQETKLEFPSKDSVPSPSANSRSPLVPKTNAPVNAPVISAVRSISSDTKALYPRSRSRSHTPSMRTRQYQQQHLNQQHLHHSQQIYLHHSHQNTHSHSTLPETPTRMRAPMIPLQRISSGFSTGHRSARRWARTAHLHEVRGSALARSGIHKRRADENDPGGDNGGDNPFWDGPKVVGKDKRKREEREREGEVKVQDEKEANGDQTILAEIEGDVWVDTDTDLEEDAYMQVSENGNACE